MEIADGTYVTALDGQHKGWHGRVYTNRVMRKTPVYIGVRHDLTVTEAFATRLRTGELALTIQGYAELLWEHQHGTDCPKDVLTVISDLESPLIKLDLPKKHRRGKPHKMRSGL